jgi:ribosomal protein S18 acetylase RimI-like enzyme
VVPLYVRPAYQRQGLGTRLLAGLIARHPDTERVRLNVVEGNDAVLQFYRRQGFAIMDEAEEEGVRSLRMERTLA